MVSVKEVLEEVEMIESDFETPSNVKQAMKKIKEILNNSSFDVAIKSDKCISLLEELQEDPNIEAFTRTNLWNLMSTLEILDSE